MPGMNSGLNVTNPILVAAFRSALLHQGLIALLLLAVLAIAWISAREWLGSRAAARSVAAEAAGHRLLRISFGILWIFDGILQAQPAMAAGLPSNVIEPTAAASPAWVQHIVNWAGTSWSYHPIQAAAAAVWIQVGIGAWLLAAPRGRSARLAGLASLAWGLVVWVFGESFGGIFAPGLTWLFGAPGAAVFYCAAGAPAGPARAGLADAAAGPQDPHRHGPVLRRHGGAAGLAGARILGRARQHGAPGTLTGMVQSMAGTSQPAVFAHWVSGFGNFTAAHGFAVNLVVVIALGAIGAGLLSGQPRLLRPAIAAATVLGLADWVLIEDFGFFGGLGTDPNSMIPILLIVYTGYLALARVPATATAAVPAAAPARPDPPGRRQPPGPGHGRPGPAAGSRPGPGWRDRLQPAGLARSFGSVSTRAVLAAWAVAIIIVGAAPAALAQANPNADPIIAQAIAGNSAPLNFAAPPFRLTDQNGTAGQPGQPARQGRPAHLPGPGVHQ